MIGLGLLHHRRHARPGTIVWDRWIAIGFAIGSLCFFVGPFPGFADLVGDEADSWVFFVGSIFFTTAAGLTLWQTTLRVPGRWSGDASWWSAAIQFAGTLFFNRSTYNATQDDLRRAARAAGLVTGPVRLDRVPGSGLIAYRVATSGKLLPERRDREWWMSAVNLLGCVLFMISAIAAFIVPSTGTVLDLAASNFTTAAAACVSSSGPYCSTRGAFSAWFATGEERRLGEADRAF